MKQHYWPLALLLGSCAAPPVHLDDCAQPASVQLPSVAEVCAKAGGNAEIACSRLGVNNLLVQGNIDASISSYEQHSELAGQHDFDLIQQMSLSILQQSSRGQPEEQVLAIFGAGISQHERMFPLLADAATHKLPQIQLAALNFLAQMQDTRADAAINRAIGSRFLITRLEAVYHLARKRYPTAEGQIDALMAKVTPELRPLIPQLYARLGTPQAQRRLRHLLMDPRADVRVAAVHGIAQSQNDALLPELRSLAKQLHPSQREACATAFGLMQDEASVPILEDYLKSTSEDLRLSSLIALYRLGRHERRADVESMARQGNCFAITALGEMTGGEELLVALLNDKDIHVRANASFALLERRDPRCVKGLAEFLLTDERDLGLQQKLSVGRGLRAWKIVPSARENFRKIPMAYEMSARHKEAALIACMDLPPEAFLALSEAILARQELPLIPLAVRLLENEQSPEAVTLLKTYSQRVGAPLTRHACRLALYRMDEPGPYRAQVQTWVLEESHRALISLRPVLPWEVHHQDEPFELTPNESSRLLFDSMEALAREQDAENISILLEALRDGHPNNRPVIAGLLLRATL